MAVAILRLTTGVVYVRSVSGTLTFASGSTLQLADGTASAPSLTFASNPDTGEFLRAGVNISTALDGVVRYERRATGDLTLAVSGTLSWTVGDATEGIDLFLVRDAPNTLAQRNGTNAQTFIIGNAGAATATISLNKAASAISATKTIKKVTGIADAVATAVLTVTVPNANHAATVKVTLLSSNGSTDAFESSRTAEGAVVVTRTSGVTAVATAATLALTGIATVAAGATHTLAYSTSAMSGAAGATQTFTINVTIDDSGNLGSSQVVVLAEVVNAEATGVTIA